MPLKPIGLHSDEPDSPDNTAVDFPTNIETITDVQGPSTPNENDVVTDTEVSKDGESKTDLKDFWAYMKAKMKAAVAWAHKTIAGLKSSSK